MRTDVTSVRDIPEVHTMGHTCADLNGELLFVWGGTNDRVAYLAIKNSSIWIYETLTGYWRHRTCSGECPPFLSSCASCLIGQKMYIFGGHSTVQDNWLNCLYCLDLETFIWSDVGGQARANPTKPIRSDKNVAWSHGGKLYVFGGYGWSQIEHLLALLDCQKDLQLVPDHRWPKFGWNNQLVEYNPGDRTWRWPHYKGKCPSARAAHSGALMGDKYFVFGGRDSRERLNDLHTFDMQTFTWQQVAVVSRELNPLQRTPRQPIGHLLEAREDATRGATHNATTNQINADNGDNDNEHDDDDYDNDGQNEDENHRQIVEEMHEVIVDEEEEEGGEEEDGHSATNPNRDLVLSSFASTSSPQATISDQLDAKPVNDDDFDDEDYEYPHPSHLLERQSLSSSGNNTTTTNNNRQDGANGACSAEEHDTPQHVGQTNAVSQQQLATNHMTAPTLSALIYRDQLSQQSQASEQLEQRREDNAAAAERDIDQRQQLQLSGVNDHGDSQRAAPPPPSPAPGDNQDHHQYEAELSDTSNNQQRPTGSNGNNRQQSTPPAPPTPPSMPPGRSFCSLTPISANEMLLFGGVNSQDENLNDCWLFNVTHNQWSQIDYTKHNHKLMRPRLWHTGSRTKQNEVVIIGGSCSDKIDEYCSDVLLISFEPRSLKRLALDTVSRAVRMKTIQRTRGIPSTLIKLIKLRKQAIALTTYRPEPTPSLQNQCR